MYSYVSVSQHVHAGIDDQSIILKTVAMSKKAYYFYPNKVFM
jgi:hypothetical protein